MKLNANLGMAFRDRTYARPGAVWQYQRYQADQYAAHTNLYNSIKDAQQGLPDRYWKASLSGEAHITTSGTNALDQGIFGISDHLLNVPP